MFSALIAEVGPTRSTVITYVDPAVALLLGVTPLDERFTVVTAVGLSVAERSDGAKVCLVAGP